MIIWITGKRKSGKTTLAKQMCSKMSAINLDGDAMRSSISTDLGYSDKDRLENNIRIAKLAVVLESQGFDVVCSTICPEHVREDVFNITGCKFIHI